MIWKSFEPFALTKEITRTWTALVKTWSSQMCSQGSAGAQLPTEALQWAAAQPRAEKYGSFVHHYLHSYCAQKPSLGLWRTAACTAPALNTQCGKMRQKWLLKPEELKLCDDSRWHARSQHTTVQGWSFPTYKGMEIFVERVEGL